MNLSELIDQSGMSVNDFAYAIGVRKANVERWLNGSKEVPAGVISDAQQLLADIDYIHSVLDHNPDLKNISYKVWKKCLTEQEQSVY